VSLQVPLHRSEPRDSTSLRAVSVTSANMSNNKLIKDLKDLEPGPNDEGLRRLREEAQGLERSSRKARVTSSGYSDNPANPSTPPRRNRRSLKTAGGPSELQTSPLTPAQRDRKLNKSGTRASKSPQEEHSAGKTTFGEGPLLSSNSRTHASESPREDHPAGKTTIGKRPLLSSTPGTSLAGGGESKKLSIKLRVPSSSQEQSFEEPPTAHSPAPTSLQPEGSPSMASQRNRPGRGGPRGATNDLTEEKDLWQQILPHLAALSKYEARAAEVNKEIFENEVQKKEKANAGISSFLTFVAIRTSLTIFQNLRSKELSTFPPSIEKTSELPMTRKLELLMKICFQRYKFLWA
jgi:hypothetical protein